MQRLQEADPFEPPTGSAACRPATATARGWCSVLSRAGTRTSRRCATATRGPSKRGRRRVGRARAEERRDEPARRAASAPRAPRRPAPWPRPASAPAAPSPLTRAGRRSPTSTTHDDVLIVVSKVKKYIRDRRGMNTSDAVANALGEHVRTICDEAIRAAVETAQDRARSRRTPRVSALTCRGSAPRAPAQCAARSRARAPPPRRAPHPYPLPRYRGARRTVVVNHALEIFRAPCAHASVWGRARRAFRWSHQRIAAPSSSPASVTGFRTVVRCWPRFLNG